MFLSNKIRECREEKKLTQSELMLEFYKEVGLQISRQTLVNWEQGVTIPDGDEIDRIAKYFRKPPGYFFNDKH